MKIMINHFDIENVKISLEDVRNQLQQMFGVGTGITHSDITGVGLEGYQLKVYMPYFDQYIIDNLPADVNGYQVVYEIGEITTLACGCVKTPNGSCNCTPISECQKKFSAKYRPLQSGGSIDNVISRTHPCPGKTTGGCCGTGTIGGFPKLPNGTTVLLSNNHVIGGDFPGYHFGAVGDKLVQPGTLDNGDIVNDIVGTLQKKITLADNSTGNKVDAAYGYIDSSVQISANGLCNYPINKSVSPVIGMKIKKAGRTTGCTTGTVTALDVNIGTNYGSGTAKFIQQFQTSANFTQAGDSGSVVVTDDGNNNAVGLLYAGSDTIPGSAFVNLMSNVESALGISFGTSTTQDKYKCINNVCTKCTDPNDTTCTFTDSNCNNTCGGTSNNWGCDDNDECVQGIGNLPAGCNNTCGGISNKYSCKDISGMKYCAIDANGQYADIIECQNACK